MKLWTGYKWRSLSPAEAKYRRARGQLADETASEPVGLPQAEQPESEPDRLEIDPVDPEPEPEPAAELVSDVGGTRGPDAKLAHDSDTPTATVEAPRAPRRCSNCGEPGHTRAKCDKPAVDKADQEPEQIEG